MKNKNMLIIVGVALIILIIIMQKPTKKLAGEIMEREFSSDYVNPGGTFTVTYNVLNPDPPYFFSIKDIITGGCTLTISSDTKIITTVTSPAIASGAISVTAPTSTGYCYFNGDWQLGSASPILFGQESVEVCNTINCVQSDWTPATNTVCNGFGYTQTRSTITSPSCGGASCGATSQGATGNKDCGSTPSITTTDTFQNGCIGGTAGTCVACYTYGDGFDASCTKYINTCSNGVDRTELGCVAQEWIDGGGQSTMRRYLGDSAQDWINKGGPS